MSVYRYLYVVALSALCLLAGCADDVSEPGISCGKLVISASISSMTPGVRSVTDYDNSNRYFSAGDSIGFYSEGGDLDNGDAGYVNEPMGFGGETGDQGVFSSEDMKTNYNTIGRSAAYFPYCKDMETAGMPARDADGCCVDFLFSDGLRNIPSQGFTTVFYHGFAMLMIEGGEGFRNFMDSPVRVKISRPVERIRFTPHDTYYRFMSFEGEGEENCYFNGRRGRFVERDPQTGSEVDKGERYCVILPADWTIRVTQIEVYDDLGRLQKIPVGSTASGLPVLECANRYPLTLKMQEMTPVIYPHDILPWGDEIMLGTTMDCGINSENDFEQWYLAYNSYVKGTLADEESLKKYGDKNKDGKWDFYLNTDLDLAKTGITSPILVDKLRDRLDARGHTIRNVTLDGSGGATSAALVGTLEEGGVIRSLNIEGISVSGNSVEYAGSFAARMTGGQIVNCTATRIDISCPGARVGGMAGLMSGGEATNCRMSGVIMGGSTDGKAVGEYLGGTRTGLDASNVIFGTLQR